MQEDSVPAELETLSKPEFHNSEFQRPKLVSLAEARTSVPHAESLIQGIQQLEENKTKQTNKPAPNPVESRAGPLMVEPFMLLKCKLQVLKSLPAEFWWWHKVSTFFPGFGERCCFRHAEIRNTFAPNTCI